MCHRIPASSSGMKQWIRIINSLPLLAALVLCACQSVTSKKPVGDKPAVLKPEVWNGKWKNGNGSFVATRVKDARLGILELKTITPWTKPKAGEPKTEDLQIRMLGTHVIANEDEHPGYQFARVANDGTHIVVFYADIPVFIKLIKQHKIAGKLEKNQDGKPDGSCTVEGFTERDYQRLKDEGFDVRSLFKEDPELVYTRDHGLW